MIVLAHGVSLFFFAKVKEAARRAGATLILGNADAPLEREAERARPSLVLVELERADLSQIEALKRRRDLPGVRVLGFASHVDEALLAAAREAGCDEVLSKGELTRRLDGLLGED
jgi:DNA-binding NarL/FixJ family response regulator